MTEWRAIPGWEGLYDVSSDGRVRRSPTARGRGAVPGRVLRANANQHGHLWVSLYPGAVKMYLHRAVGLTFLSRPAGGEVVRHLDNDPSNNDVSNLAWGTQGDNVDDAVRAGRMSNGRRAIGECPKGHPYSAENTHVSRRGWRVCRACSSERSKAKYQRKKEAA